MNDSQMRVALEQYINANGFHRLTLILLTILNCDEAEDMGSTLVERKDKATGE